MSGPVTFRDNTIVVTELAQTDMGCLTGGLTEQDQFVAEFLTAKPAYTYDGTTLDLKTPDTEIVFGPKKSVQPDLPLEGTRWDITHVTSGPAAGSTDSNAAVGASVAPPEAYLKFAEGKVSGNDGCNSFSGDATIGTDTVTFGPIVSTKRACPSTHDDGVLAVLSGTVSWRIDHTVLTLTNPSGAGLQLSADEGSTPNAGTPSPGAAGGAPVVTPPCCKPLVTPGVGSSGGATGTGGAPTTVNTAGPADPPPGY
jgi:heat shock protein HslJ